jgi:hypothetical protein
MRVDDVGHSGETDHERRDQRNCRKLTHNGIDDGNAKMPMALQTQCDGRAKISEANAWRMVFHTTSSAVGRPQQTIRHAYITTHEKLGFEGERGQLRECWLLEIEQHGDRVLNPN